MIKTIQSSLDQDDISSFDDLPDGWECKKLGEIVSPSKEKIEPTVDSTFPYIGLEHIESNSSKIIGHGIASEVKSTKTVFYAGDVLYGKLRPYLNKVAIPDFDGVCSTDILVFNQNQKIDSRYLMRYLSTREVVEYANQRSKGNSLPRVSFKSLAEIPIPLPPLAEQQRIVARVEALLSHVDAAGDRLRRVPAIMKRFRQSVLAAACSGRLTEGWREGNPENISAFEELTELCRERKTRSNEYLKHFEKASTSLPIKSETDDIDIPDTWYLTNLGFLAFVTKLAGFEYTKYFNLKDTGEIPVIRAQNVQMGKFVNSKIKYTSQDISNILERSQINGGEVLIVYVGAGVGNVCLAPSNGRWHLSSNVGKIELDWMFNKYLLLYLQSHFGLDKILAVSKATAQPSLSMRSIRETVVFVPPLAEQHEIVLRVDLLFERADAIEREVAAAGRRCERLTQAVMVKAFSGML